MPPMPPMPPGMAGMAGLSSGSSETAATEGHGEATAAAHDTFIFNLPAGLTNLLRYFFWDGKFSGNNCTFLTLSY